MKLLFLSLALILSSTVAHASVKVVGNGGSIVVCRSATGQITKAEAFDLYEGRALNRLSYEERSVPFAEQARAVIERLAKTLGHTKGTDGGLPDLFERVQKNLIFLPEGTGLKPIPDGAEFILPKGCELVQTINFRDFTHIYVDSDIWAALSPTQKAALLVHETLYWYLRDPGPKGSYVETNSVRTRRAVALLFSGQAFAALAKSPEEAIAKPLRCYTHEALEADRPSTHFYAVPLEGGRILIQFLKFRDRNLLTETSTLIKGADLSRWPLSMKDQPWTVDGKVSSLLDSDFYASLSWWPLSPEHNRIHVRDGDGNDSVEPFICE